MSEKVIFRFSGSDSLARFGVFVLLTGGGAGPVVFYLFGAAFQISVLTTIAIVVAISGVVFIGLRSAIVVSENRTTITKLWLFIPYWSWSAVEIQDVWYGGDWGEPDDALGVVVQLGKDEIHIGSRKTMHNLYAALLPLSNSPLKRLPNKPLQPIAPKDGAPAER